MFGPRPIFGVIPYSIGGMPVTYDPLQRRITHIGYDRITYDLNGRALSLGDKQIAFDLINQPPPLPPPPLPSPVTEASYFFNPFISLPRQGESSIEETTEPSDTLEADCEQTSMTMEGGIIIYCSICGQSAGIPEKCTSDYGHDFVQAEPSCRIVYCSTCGKAGGKPEKCTNDYGHSFVEAEADCRVIYCSACGKTGGKSEKCTNDYGHSFVEAASNCQVVYCSTCGKTDGKPEKCISDYGHSFVEAEADCRVIYCSTCGMRGGKPKKCTSDYGHSFVEAITYD